MPRRTDVIELAVLGVLEDSPMHGYHLRKHVTALLGPWRAALSFGTLYPTLRRLQAGGFVVSQGAAVPAGPTGAGPTVAGSKVAGSKVGGPKVAGTKVVYQVTEAGRARCRELLANPGAALSDDDAFGVRFAFFARLDPQDRVRVLEQRRARLLDRLEHARSRGCAEQEGSRDPYRRAWAQRGVASVEAELAWTDARLAAERSGVDSPRTG